MRRLSATRAALVALMAATAACAGDASPAAPSAATIPAVTVPAVTVPEVTVPATTGPATTVPAATVDPVAAAEAMCARTGVEPSGNVASATLVEASGLVASRTHPGVLWSHNDGGDAAVVAVGSDGADLGVFPVPVTGAVDAEDIALVGEPGDGSLLLGDIGDNSAQREEIRVDRFAEPDPHAPAAIVDVETLRFRYPDRPHNAEAMMVDDEAGVIVIVTKEQAPDTSGEADAVGRTAPSFVFEGPLDGHVGVPVELTMVGVLDTVALEQRASAGGAHPASLLGFGGVPTGGDVSPDGSLIALRTYQAVWLWPRLPGQRVSEALVTLDEFPCEIASVPEAQGEAVAFVDDGLMTLGEGRYRPLHRLAR